MNKIIAGTGHRPHMFPGKYNMEHEWIQEIRETLRLELELSKPKRVISGMAIGWDMILAEVAIELEIPVHAYIPFKGQGSNWPEKSQTQYKNILRQCSGAYYCSPAYSKDSFFIRDELMVDHCDEVYALWGGIKKGGTWHTVKYAKKEKRPIVNFWKE